VPQGAAPLERRRRWSLYSLYRVAAAGRGPHQRVIHYNGKLESNLRREVGRPTREEPVVEEGDIALCSGPGAERALTYELPSGGTKKRVRQMFRMGPAESNVACVDATGRVVSVEMIEF
jgi:hypothetical protein